MARTTLIDVQYDFCIPETTKWEETQKKLDRLKSLWRMIPAETPPVQFDSAFFPARTHSFSWSSK